MASLPAISVDAHKEKLTILAHETVPTSLRYTDWQKFQEFADHKDFPDMLARHRARGLSETDFSETYSRHVKALVAVDDGAGQDRALGLETEFVALANPYTDDLSARFPVALTYDGATRANAQVEVFEKAPDGTVEIML